MSDTTTTKKQKNVLVPIIVAIILLLVAVGSVLLIVFRPKTSTPSNPPANPNQWLQSNSDIYTFEEVSAEEAYTITGVKEGATLPGEYVILPNTHNGQKVTGVGSNAFATETRLKGVAIPASVTTIADNAFAGNTSLEVIYIGITPSGTQGFVNMVSDTEAQPVTIGASAFANCTKLKKVELANTVTEIGVSAFEGCTNLGGIVLPNQVSAIKDNAFKDCTSLKTINIPSSVETIGNTILNNCENITDIEIACIKNNDDFEKLNVIFENSGLYFSEKIEKNINVNTTFNLFNHETEHEFTEEELYELKTYLLESNLCVPNNFYNEGDSDRGGELFQELLQSIKNNSTTLDYVAEVLELNDDEKNYLSVSSRYSHNNYLITSINKKIRNLICPIEKFNLKLSGDFTKISQSFSETYLKDLLVGTLDFSDASQLTDIGDVDGTYSSNPFNGNKIINYINFPESLKSIGANAFYETNLISVTIPKGVSYIGQYAFRGNQILKEINYNAEEVACPVSGNTNWEAFSLCGYYTEEGITFNIGDSVKVIPAGICASNCSSHHMDGFVPYITKIVFDDNSVCESIGNYAFYYITSSDATVFDNNDKSIYGLNNKLMVGFLNKPDTLTNIASQAFGGTTIYTITDDYGNMYKEEDSNLVLMKIKDQSITSCEINENVNIIDSYAFGGCNKLNSIVIPSSVIEIRGRAFFGCTNVSSIMISAGVTKIGESAFGDCCALTSITVDVNNTNYSSIGNCLIDQSTKTLLKGCNTSIIPQDGSITSIGPKAFYNCSGLNGELNVPSSVTYIDQSAFAGCTGLTSLSLPNNLFSISQGAFAGCTGLTNVIIPSVANFVEYYAFGGCTGLTSVKISSGVNGISRSAFGNCDNLTKVIIDSNQIATDNNDLEGLNIAYDSKYKVTHVYINTETVKGNLDSYLTNYFTRVKDVSTLDTSDPNVDLDLINSGYELWIKDSH